MRTINNKSLSQLAKETGIKYNTLYVRYKRNKWQQINPKPKRKYQKNSDAIMLPFLKEFVRQRNLNYVSVYSRLKMGWTIHDAIYKPIRKQTYNITLHAKKHNISYNSIKNKLNKGMTIEQAIEATLKNKEKLKNTKTGLTKEMVLKSGLKEITIRKRLKKGWSLDKALNTPLLTYRNYTYNHLLNKELNNDTK